MIQGITYRFCPNGKTRYLGIDTETGNIEGHPTAGPSPGGSPVQDDDQDFSLPCKDVGITLFEDSNFRVVVKSSFPFGTVSSSQPPPPPPPPPVVCGLESQIVSISPESAIDAADGTIVVKAKDVNTQAFEKLNIGSDFVYNTEGMFGTVVNGETFWTLQNLVSGTYFLFIRNSLTCLSTIQVFVPVISHTTKYRLDFKSVDGKEFRFDIEKFGYTGSIIEVKGSSTPVSVSYRNQAGEDIFAPVIPSETLVQIISRVNGEFLELYTSNNSEFIGRLYLKVGVDYVLEWTGTLVSMLYSEPYARNFNYPINITFVDLGVLAKKKFGNTDGNFYSGRISLFKAISDILFKTGFQIEISESANVYNSVIPSTDLDSMLKTIFFNPNVFLNEEGEPMDSLTVLNSLMQNFGLRVYQAGGKWNIDLVTQKFSSSVVTRTFDMLGDLVSAAINPRVPLRGSNLPGPKVNWRDSSQNLNIPERFGEVKVTFDLGIESKNNMLASRDFSEVDESSGQFIGWAVTADAGVVFGVEKLVEERDGLNNALFVDFAAAGKRADINSSPITLFSTGFQPTEDFSIVLSLDVFAIPAFKEAHIYLDWALTFNDGVILAQSSDGETSNLVEQQFFTGKIDAKYNRVFLEKTLAWEKLTTTIEAPSTGFINSTVFTGAMRLEIRLRSNDEFDTPNVTSFRAIATDENTTFGAINRNKFKKIRVLDLENGQEVIRTYSLQTGTLLDNFPEVVRPNDFSFPNFTVPPIVLGNQTYWKLENTVARPGVSALLKSILITNAIITYLPKKDNPIESLVETVLVDGRIDRSFEKTVFLGDLISISTDNNFRHITDSYLTDSSGVPIPPQWFRKGTAEAFPLHVLLSKMFQGQHAIARWKLSGNIWADGTLLRFSNILQEFITGRLYMPVALTQNLAKNEYIVEILEGLKGDAIDDIPGGDPPPPVEPPVSTREHTDEFTLEFS